MISKVRRSLVPSSADLTPYAVRLVHRFESATLPAQAPPPTQASTLPAYPSRRTPRPGSLKEARHLLCKGHKLGPGRLNGEVQEPVHVERLPGDQTAQRLPLHQLHGDEGMSLVFAKFVNGADVGVIEGRGRARLPL